MPRLWIGKLDGAPPELGEAVSFTCFGNAKPGDLALLYVPRTSKAFTHLARVESKARGSSPWWPRHGSVVATWRSGLTLADARVDGVLGGWGLIKRNMTPPAGHEPAVSLENRRRLAMKLPGLDAHLSGRNPQVAGLGPLARTDRLGQAVIRCLGESAAEAARRRPEAWGLTVPKGGHRARLNVGRVEVFVVDGKADHFIVCLRKKLPSRASLERLDGSVSSADYVSLSSPVIVRFPERAFARGYQLVRAAHFAAIAEGARYRHYSWKASHSPEAVRRVSAVSGIDLPDPLYAKSARKTFLLTSNPETERDGFSGFEAGATGPWRCWNKDPVPGDRLFWVRQGRDSASRGLFASGIVTRGRGPDGRITYRVEKAGDFNPPGLLPLAELVKAAPDGPWKTQRSGAAIDADDARIVEQVWRGFVEGDAAKDADDDPAAPEGRATLTEVTRRFRDLGLRSRKIASVMKAKGRVVCEVPNCGFDFFAAYGDPGRDFAIVHHEDPIGTRKRASKTQSSRLRIVCANCHAMIHRGGGTRPLAAIRISQAWRRRNT